jgi:glucose-6-phosphate 1-dehydrogenase
VDLSAARLREERVRLFRQVREVDPDDVVRGQYRGYVDEEGVAGGSDVETFVALRLWIDSWRWAGVPFLIRAGKNLAATATEAVVEFKQPPRQLFGGRGGAPLSNHLRFRLGRDDGVTLQLQTKAPGEHLATKAVSLDVSYEEALGHRQGAYERLLDDAMDGDTTRFGGEDSLEQQWRIVDPVLRQPPSVRLYSRGTWGPEAASRLLNPGGSWYEPT